MATYVPPKRGVALELWVGLASQADTKLLQANPTLAAGDVKVSKDGGALANLATLPTVTPAAGKIVKVSLSAAEMTADNVTVVFSDAAGAEWCDLVLNVQTAARQVDDLAFPNISGRGIDVSAGGDVDAAVASIATDALAAGAVAAAAANKIADHILRRSYANARASADGDAVSFRSLLGGLSKLVNKVAIAAGVLTAYHEDDVAVSGTQAVTTNPAADHVTALDT
jgi:hypothetical protein